MHYNLTRDINNPHRRDIKSKASFNQVAMMPYPENNDLLIVLNDIESRITKLKNKIATQTGTEDTLPSKCNALVEEIS